MNLAAPARPMTATQFLDWANQLAQVGRRYELDCGKVEEMPSPGELHGTICWILGVIFGQYLFQRKAGHVCTNDTGLVIHEDPGTVRGPDLMVFLEPRTFTSLNRGHVDRVPALVVEVLSPTDRFSATLRRVDQYLERGVPLVWVVDPDERGVHQFRAGEFRKFFAESDELTGNGVLPAFRCPVAQVFSVPGEPAPSTPLSTPNP